MMISSILNILEITAVFHLALNFILNHYQARIEAFFVSKTVHYTGHAMNNINSRQIKILIWKILSKMLCSVVIDQLSIHSWQVHWTVQKIWSQDTTQIVMQISSDAWQLIQKKMVFSKQWNSFILLYAWTKSAKWICYHTPRLFQTCRFYN